MHHFFWLLLVGMLGQSASAETFKIDPSHTGINFSVAHLVVSKVKGRFDKFEGTFDFDEKNQHVDHLSVVIQAASINTNQEDRDKDLRSDHFLDASKYPTLVFKSTKTVYDSNQKPQKIEGNLTIHGITKSITLDVNYRGAVNDPMGMRRLAFDAETHFDRRDFNVKWNKPLDSGGFVVGDDVKIDIEGEAILATAKTGK